MSSKIISSFNTVEFGGETVRVADLNSDGAYELLIVQSDQCTREVTCLTAVDIYGNRIWQTGTPSSTNSGIYSDISVQVYDWDGDGANEVLWIEQAIYAESIVWDYSTNTHITVPTSRRGELRGHKGYAQEGAKRYEEDAIMHVLDGATGQEKYSFSLPAPADDCFLFANLTGGLRRQDLIVKDRYWNMWGIAHNGDILWKYEGTTGHFPEIADVDNDGMDEIYLGYTLLDHDGKLLWEMDGPKSHQDSSYVVQSNGETRLVFSHGEGENYNGGVHALTPSRKEIWSREFGHAQFVFPGRFRPDAGDMQFAVVDIGWPTAAKRQKCNITILDWDGNELYRKDYPDGTGLSARAVDWSGPGQPTALAVWVVSDYEHGTLKADNGPAVLLDGYGNELESLPLIRPDGTQSVHMNLIPADIYGDSREEIIIVGRDSICTYTNTQLNLQTKLYNMSVYRGL